MCCYSCCCEKQAGGDLSLGGWCGVIRVLAASRAAETIEIVTTGISGVLGEKGGGGERERGERDRPLFCGLCTVRRGKAIHHHFVGEPANPRQKSPYF